MRERPAGRYTSFREAAHPMGLPRALRNCIPDVWRTEAVLRPSSVPVLVVHGGAHRLFPVSMGRALAQASGGTLAVLEGMGHSDLHARPTLSHWRVVLDWILALEYGSLRASGHEGESA